jgi:hypothetical protein
MKFQDFLESSVLIPEENPLEAEIFLPGNSSIMVTSQDSRLVTGGSPNCIFNRVRYHEDYINPDTQLHR